ncbi:type IV secretory system conjugative DNA transfer family protein [Parasulfitobacter algicola]|uniref:Type IV secretory system conjugative DNA transfer family protein n=1 Tax=Parasulfitobacter algicola TaxID=2614809 RepID=A0ABX2IS16_9RHOB|nr:type IV secretory system conjugative DNA transfer family protein [Sulfitobacter algicola]NSX54806.1 type IV secretory system conjugative DNA transfer family protein [Sulfitobacter algicola]
MTRSQFVTAVLAASSLVLIASQSADARSVFESWFYDPYTRQSTGGIIFYRVLLMAIPSGIGFALGWILSPQGREARVVTLMLMFGVAVLIGMFHTGNLGWVLAGNVAIAGFLFGLFYWLARGVRSLSRIPTTFGSAKWATRPDLVANKLIGVAGIHLGKFGDSSSQTDISYQGDRHLLTIAPTRSGKGTTQIIPNLLTYQGSMLVIDPKGENALITAKARQKLGQKVHVVDPWGIASDTGLDTARFNPMDWLVEGDLDIAENAMLLADALVIADNHGDQFWIEEAKALIQGIILFVATDPEEDGQRHLGRVRDLLLQNSETLKKLFAHMTHSPHHIVRSTGERCLQKETKLMSNVLATAQAQTHFLDSTKLRDSLSQSDFAFDDLKASPMTVYLVLPADRLHTFSRWLRSLVQQAVTVNARDIATKPAKPVLFLLDELPSLGRLTMIEQAYSLMAGFGLQLWGIVQDCSQLKSLYGEGWETFIGNSGVVQYFGSRDRMTAEYFSALCGDTTVWNFSTAVSATFSSSSGATGGGSSNSTGNTDTRAAAQRKLAYPDELMRLSADNQLLFVENMDPIIAHKRPWFKDPALKKLGANLYGADAAEPKITRSPQSAAEPPAAAAPAE